MVLRIVFLRSSSTITSIAISRSLIEACSFPPVLSQSIRRIIGGFPSGTDFEQYSLCRKAISRDRSQPLFTLSTGPVNPISLRVLSSLIPSTSTGQPHPPSSNGLFLRIALARDFAIFSNLILRFECPEKASALGVHSGISRSLDILMGPKP